MLIQGNLIHCSSRTPPLEPGMNKAGYARMPTPESCCINVVSQVAQQLTVVRSCPHRNQPWASCYLTAATGHIGTDYCRIDQTGRIA